MQKTKTVNDHHKCKCQSKVYRALYKYKNQCYDKFNRDLPTTCHHAFCVNCVLYTEADIFVFIYKSI